MKRGMRRLRKPQWFLILMAAALLAALLPPGYTSWLGALLQPLAWVQGLGARATRAAGTAADAQGRDAELEQLRRLAAHQGLLLAQLEGRLEQLTGLRDALRDPHTRIVPAAVLGADPSPLRDTLSIGRGATAGIDVGDWVVGGYEDSVGGILSGWIVGRVATVYPQTSTVQLTVDRGFGPVPVRALRRLPDGRWQVSMEQALLYGRGSGRMEVYQTSYDFVGSGFESAVLRVGTSAPLELTVGRFGRSVTAPTSDLHFTIDVIPPGEATALAEVYVLTRREGG